MDYKLLVIEDEVVIRRGIRYSIDWKALEITEFYEAGDGEEGIEAIKKYRPDIVITDICMPGCSGLDVIDKTLIDYKYIPIIISGYSDFEYAQKAIEYGVTGFLLKPINIDKLIETVEKAKTELHKQSLIDAYKDSYTQVLNMDLLTKNSITENGPIVTAMIEYVHKNYSKKLTLKTIADYMHYSENFIMRKFKEEMKMNFSEYLSKYRITKSMEMMRNTNEKISDIAIKCGFSEYKYYKYVFNRMVGCSPKEFKKIVEEEKIFAKK